MKITVVTSFSPRGYEIYGRQCVETVKTYWPSETNLICAYEGVKPGGVEGFDLLEYGPSKSFIRRHADNDFVKGKLEYPLSPWAGKAKRSGYCFRHDAYKFARKVFAVAYASRHVDMGRLFWLDADVVTFKDIPKAFLVDILPPKASLAYLPRSSHHSELGFVGYNLDNLETHSFITAYEAQYAEDKFFVDPNWDDCNQFDYLVQKLNPSTAPIPSLSRAYPFDTSRLAEYMRHNKGRRKAAA
jgi:hypothetical protein